MRKKVGEKGGRERGEDEGTKDLGMGRIGGWERREGGRSGG